MKVFMLNNDDINRVDWTIFMLKDALKLLEEIQYEGYVTAGQFDTGLAGSVDQVALFWTNTARHLKDLTDDRSPTILPPPDCTTLRKV